MFLINTVGHYFEIIGGLADALDKDFLLARGCQIFDSEAEMVAVLERIYGGGTIVPESNLELRFKPGFVELRTPDGFDEVLIEVTNDLETHAIEMALLEYSL